MAKKKKKVTFKARPAQRSNDGEYRIDVTSLMKHLKQFVVDLKAVPQEERGTDRYKDTVTFALRLVGQMRCQLGMTYSTWTNR